jgi:hypothetical protein
MLELTITVKKNNKEITLTTKQLFRLMDALDDILGETKMLQLLRRYLRLMRTHDFSYHYSDDMDFWLDENQKRIKIIMLKITLMLTRKGRKIVTLAERKWGYV